MAEIVRALDANHDWLFGQGLLDYKSNLAAVAQDIDCNLQMFLGDCFFAINNGIDWFNLLGGKNQLAINLAINAAILNTIGVTGILQTSFSISENRALTVVYNVQTVYSTLQSTFTYDFGTSGT
jgi:hypothetical protein